MDINNSDFHRDGILPLLQIDETEIKLINITVDCETNEVSAMVRIFDDKGEIYELSYTDVVIASGPFASALTASKNRIREWLNTNADFVGKTIL
jgi:hypothetical protein